MILPARTFGFCAFMYFLRLRRKYKNGVKVTDTYTIHKSCMHGPSHNTPFQGIPNLENFSYKYYHVNILLFLLFLLFHDSNDFVLPEMVPMARHAVPTTPRRIFLFEGPDRTSV